MLTFWQDLRFAARGLRKNPGFTAVAVATLALGIGANTAIFSVVDAAVLRPLPYSEPEALVRVGGANPRKGRAMTSFSPHDFFDWREQNGVFEGLAAYDRQSLNLVEGGEPERIEALAVSANFFSVLRARPAHGRAFLPHEETPGRGDVAVLSHRLWQRRFGSDPGVVGRAFTLSGHRVTVVGVMPPEFESPPLSRATLAVEPELWVPFAPDLSGWARSSRSVDAAVARLKPGVSVEAAAAELRTVAARLEQQHPETNTGQGVGVVSLHESVVGGARATLTVFLVAVGFVLLIACANVANLLLARAAGRQKEVAIRAALGASRLRLVRQLLAESALLSLAGGALGLLLAAWATDGLAALSRGFVPRVEDVGLDARVLLFTLAASALTGAVFGLAPALQASKPNLNAALKEGGRAIGAERRGLRGLLVVSEVALSLVLLVGAGLLVKSFVRLQAVSPGFDPENLLTMYVSLPGSKYPEGRRHVAFFNEVLERLRGVAGVEAAGAVSVLPVSENFDRFGLAVEGQPALALGDAPEADRYRVTAGYFSAMSIPLKAGRTFDERDGADAPAVAVVNETFARRYWPEGGALGKRVKGASAGYEWAEVVGVVGDVKQTGLDAAPTLQVYFPHAQSPTQHMTLVVRTAGSPDASFAAVRDKVWEVDREQPVYNIRTMEQLLSASVAQRRLGVLVLGVFAGLALVLAVVGLYGVVSYSVARRTREIGIRMALGARGADVLKMVLGQGMALTLAGTAVGVGGALALTRLMAGLLYGVSAADAATYVAAAGLLAAVALLACYVPARRATKVDPMVALRHE